MNQTARSIPLLLLLSPILPVPAQSAQQANAAPPQNTATAHAAPHTQNPGERAFQNHCSRCHYAPEDLNPRFTGTVVRHMRVRANLSAEEERLIMSYFLP